MPSGRSDRRSWLLPIGHRNAVNERCVGPTDPSDLASGKLRFEREADTLTVPRHVHRRRLRNAALEPILTHAARAIAPTSGNA